VQPSKFEEPVVEPLAHQLLQNVYLVLQLFVH
jgi:hypothetical protein